MDDMWKTVLESRSTLNDVRRRFRNCQRAYIEPASTNETKNNSRTNSYNADSEDGEFHNAEQSNSDSNKKEDTFSTDDSEHVSEELVSAYCNRDCKLLCKFELCHITHKYILITLNFSECFKANLL